MTMSNDDKYLLKKLKFAIRNEIRQDCRKEAMQILELADDSDREDFLKYHEMDRGHLCCLVLDFAKKKLVDSGKLEQKECDCFKDPYKWFNEDGNKKES